jgi:hypothetical protein
MAKTQITKHVPEPSLMINGSDSEPEANAQQQQPANEPQALSLARSPELDLERFRINQDFATHVQTRKVAVSVSVRRPDRQHWIFIHADRRWRAAVALLEDKLNQRTFIVIPELVPELNADLVPKLLVAYATRQGNVSLWPIRMPDESGRLDTYSESALSIVEQYSAQWIRVLPNQTDRCYDVLQSPSSELTPPKWPEGGFEQLFSLAFKNRVIDHIDHPVLKTFRGESQ